MNNKFFKYLSVLIGIPLSVQTGFSAMNKFDPYFNMSNQLNNQLYANMIM